MKELPWIKNHENDNIKDEIEYFISLVRYLSKSEDKISVYEDEYENDNKCFIIEYLDNEDNIKFKIYENKCIIIYSEKPKDDSSTSSSTKRRFLLQKELEVTIYSGKFYKELYELSCDIYYKKLKIIIKNAISDLSEYDIITSFNRVNNISKFLDKEKED